ncbi:MAG TPA: HD domain-containing protein [Chthoniobacterales bacterium]|nr:HD domain-containing protein [Chthoniobacterales bacterium]
MSSQFTIEQIREAAQSANVTGTIHAQIETNIERRTRELKPFLELTVRDLTGSLVVRVWQDHPCFVFCGDLPAGACIALEGEFVLGTTFGLEPRNWSIRSLSPEEKQVLFAGSPESQELQQRDYAEIEKTVASIVDPRLRRVSELFLEEFTERFRRAAGARSVHHARRGGLVQHVSQMLRTVAALMSVYPHLNRDLLLAGVLFHDAGKLWENTFPKEGFQMPYDLLGELVGHITIGAEIVNRLWTKLRQEPLYESWKNLKPESELVRWHLLHLVAAHHGEKQFGSPVEPKTPEAIVLHFIDNLDAKLEIMAGAYRTGHRLSADIIERVRPLPGHLVEPLPIFKLGNE